VVITRLKAKNQVTIPKDIVKKLKLKPNELFEVETEENFIKLIPVELKPKYTKEEIKKIDEIVEREKGKAKSFKAGKEFSSYIEDLK